MEEEPEPRSLKCIEIPLKKDNEGEVSSCLFYRKASTPTQKAILYVHGFMDFFFHEHLALACTANGYDFYAIELRKYGRALKDHQSPNYATDLKIYYEELDAAVHKIRSIDQHTFLLLMGHSTGGTITSLFAKDRAGQGVIDALFLNSPFFEFNLPFALRVGMSCLSALGRIFPKGVVPMKDWPGIIYRESLHIDYHGDWDYDQRYKPYLGFPIYFGWIRGVKRAHKRIQKGLNLNIPVLLMHSDKSLRPNSWNDETMLTDVVLDVEHMKRYGLGLGDQTILFEVRGGIHDLVLSKPLIREVVFAKLFDWLEGIEVQRDLATSDI